MSYYRVQQAEYSIRVLVATPREYVNKYSTRRPHMLTRAIACSLQFVVRGAVQLQRLHPGAVARRGTILIIIIIIIICRIVIVIHIIHITDACSARCHISAATTTNYSHSHSYSHSNTYTYLRRLLAGAVAGRGTILMIIISIIICRIVIVIHGIPITDPCATEAPYYYYYYYY